MFPGWLQIAIVVLLVILLFGRGKISGLMGDLAKGITSFKKGLREDPDDVDEAPKAVEKQTTIDGEVVSKEKEKSEQ